MVATKKKLETLLAPAVQEELASFTENIRRLKAGEFDQNDFRKFRLNNGVYGIRNEVDRHMIRIKCPHGMLSADQLDVVADISEKYTRYKIAHVTTRQAIQIHHVHIDHVVEVLRRLNECGLTTREACGNTVRNVTATPYAGLLADEAFDVSPYAEGVFRHFLRNPINQNLPRKFKIAFYGGGKADIAYTAIHDIGFVAAKKTVDGVEKKGFRVYVGGGLGATPHAAILLEDFTPVEELYPTAEAIVHVFDRHGDRKDKFHARLKFVVKKLGADAFRKLVVDERNAVRSTRAGGWTWTFPEDTEADPPILRETIDASAAPAADFENWRQTNVAAQKHDGYSVVTVVLKLGDFTVDQMRNLADIAREFNGGQLRTMVQQNVVLPWIRNEHLVALHKALLEAGLATSGALRLSDVTRCPGADTCQIAVTKSRGLASAILDLFNNGLAPDRDLENLSIKISGCTNSCGQHHIGNIGFFGTYRKVNGKDVPHYQVLLGGHADEGEARFGQPIVAVPARRAPEVVKHLIALYKSERQANESFVKFVERAGRTRFKDELEPFRSLPPFDQNSEMYYEWGEFTEFRVQIGQGECAA